MLPDAFDKISGRASIKGSLTLTGYNINITGVHNPSLIRMNAVLQRSDRTLLADQRLNFGTIEFQHPNSGGKSRQGHPVRMRNNMASTIIRS